MDRRFIQGLRQSRALAGLLGGLVVAAMVAVPSAWAAINDSTGSTTYTGCLSSAGNVYNVAQGSSPLASCNGADTQVTLAGGDITSVTAGTGLTGGATTGDATLGLDPAYQLPALAKGVSLGLEGVVAGGRSGPLPSGRRRPGNFPWHSTLLPGRHTSVSQLRSKRGFRRASVACRRG